MNLKVRMSAVFLFAATVLIVANVLQNSSLILYLGRDYVKYVYSLELSIIVGFLIICIIQKRIIIAFSMVLYAFFVVLECMNFSDNAAVGLNLNSSFPYVIMASICVFYEKHIRLKSLLKNIYTISAIYAAVYIAIVLLFPDFYKPNSGFAPTSPFKLFGRDHYSDARLVLSTPYVAFGLVYAIASIKARFRITHLINASLFVVAILLSNYRYMMFAVMPGIAILWVYPLYKRMRWVIPIGFVLGTAFMVSGAFLKQFNVYDLFSSDQSGYARVIEYNGAKEVIAHHLLFGFGIPSSREDMDAVIKLAHPLFYDDIGPMGVLCGFGLFGLTAYLAMGLVLSNFRISSSKPSPWEMALLGVGLFLTIYSFTAPTFWGEDGSVFAALIFAYQLKARRKLTYVPQRIKTPEVRHRPGRSYGVSVAASKRRVRRLHSHF